jgi:hypothetical protein
VARDFTNPLDHLHGLPVAMVNQDRGAMIGTRRINIGQKVERGLSESPAVSGRLGLADTTLGAAEQAMDRGALYAAVLIPSDFTAWLLSLAGVSAGGAGSGRPEIVILTNPTVTYPPSFLTSAACVETRDPWPWSSFLTRVKPR